jgi:hypothetical protein
VFIYKKGMVDRHRQKIAFQMGKDKLGWRA